MPSIPLALSLSVLRSQLANVLFVQFIAAPSMWTTATAEKGRSGTDSDQDKHKERKYQEEERRMKFETTILEQREGGAGGAGGTTMIVVVKAFW